MKPSLSTPCSPPMMLLLPLAISLSVLISGCNDVLLYSSTEINTDDTSSSTQNPGDTLAVTLTPLDSSSNVATDINILAKFNQSMVASSIDGSSFSLSNGNSVAVDINYDAGSTTASLTPQQPLNLLTTYTVSLTSIIEDLAGNSLAASSTSFTTRDGLWQGAEINDMGSANISQFEIGMDNQGNAMAVFQRYDAPGYNIYVNQYTAVGGWGTPLLIETEGGNASYPVIAVNSRGQAVAAWQQSGGSSNTFANYYEPGMGWGTAVAIENDDSGSIIQPRVAINDNGDAVVAWLHHDGISKRRIAANVYKAGIGWANHAVLTDVAAETADNAEVAIDATGQALVIWKQGSNIYSARYDTANGWQTAELIQSNIVNAAYSNVLSVNAGGDAMAVWLEAESGVRSVYANRYIKGQGWQGAQLIESETDNITIAPSVAVADNGHVMVAWQQNVIPGSRIYATHYSDAGGWSTPAKVQDNDERANYPLVKMDAAGNAMVIWLEEDPIDSYNLVKSRRYVADGSWNGVELLLPKIVDQSAQNLHIDISASGSIFALWKQSTNPGAVIYSNRFDGTSTATYAIGDTGPAGGTVFHITNGGRDGLEAAPVDQGAGSRVEWGCYGVEVSGADGIAIGSGKQNTADIAAAGCTTFAGQAGGLAVDLVNDYSLNGYSDWFLPSKDELNVLFAAKDIVGGFVIEYYWSSSEMDTQYIWNQYFDTGANTFSGDYKDDKFRVRAIRTF
ncbi:MAG: Ig-like domain-containing protein [Pseudomonadales bacterium]|nr:Ig-like domain-containing protein [Pseudomonadales bacterium]